jgi:acyl-coenzyme A thioesterase PaaI-like protein
MLDGLFKPSGGVGSGQVTGVLLSGQYRVQFKGRPGIAVSQAGRVEVGAQVTIAETAAGLVIVSAGSPVAATITEVTISG